MHLIIGPDGVARWGSKDYRCALGRNGRSADKREGDGRTPTGAFFCRRILWRADRVHEPGGRLPREKLNAASGWCDDPGDPAYNLPVDLPYPARTEALWRDDGVYDVIVPLSYNDAPVVAGKGSAIFLHVARADYAPTEGCVALALEDLCEFLAQAGSETRIVVTG